MDKIRFKIAHVKVPFKHESGLIDSLDRQLPGARGEDYEEQAIGIKQNSWEELFMKKRRYVEVFVSTWRRL